MFSEKSFYKKVQVVLFIFSCLVGSGVFLLPTALSGGGYSSIGALFFVGFISTFLAKVYAETGKNSQELICEAFGKRISAIFFIIYWLAYVLAEVVILKELIGYLKCDPLVGLYIQVGVWILFTGLNLWNFKYSIAMSSVISFLKLIPFIGLIIGFFITKFTLQSTLQPIFIHQIEPLNISVFLRCFWCFVGVEAGVMVSKNLNTTTEERRDGVFWGVLFVVVFYILGVLCCYSIAGTDALYKNQAPYITVFQKSLSFFLSDNIVVNFVKLVVSITLIGSINSWTISNGLMGYEGALAGILPKNFTVKNKNNVPYISTFFASVCVLSIMLLSHNSNIYSSIMALIDITCCFLLLVYSMCLLAYAKVYLKDYQKIFYCSIAFIFFSAFGAGLYLILVK